MQGGDSRHYIGFIETDGSDNLHSPELINRNL